MQRMQHATYSSSSGKDEAAGGRQRAADRVHTCSNRPARATADQCRQAAADAALALEVEGRTWGYSGTLDRPTKGTQLYAIGKTVALKGQSEYSRGKNESETGTTWSSAAAIEPPPKHLKETKRLVLVSPPHRMPAIGRDRTCGMRQPHPVQLVGACRGHRPHYRLLLCCTLHAPVARVCTSVCRGVRQRRPHH